jgi:DNA-binding SARP family transcriptional activator
MQEATPVRERAEGHAVQLCGPFAVTVAGERVDIPAGRAAELLQLLAIHRGRLVSTDRIIDALWDEPPPSALHGVASLVSRLRRALGRDVIEGDRGGYRLRADVTTDLAEVEELVAVANGQLRAGAPAPAVARVERALALLDRGDFIEASPYATWAEASRRALARTRRQAREIGWVAAAQFGDHALAARLAEQALLEDELDEGAALAAMTSWSMLGQPGRSEAVYQRLADALHSSLQVAPSEEVRRRRDATLAAHQPDPGRAAGAHKPPPVGRTAQLDALRGAWAEAQHGCRVVVVRGVAGSGKTHLVESLLGDIEQHGGRVLRAVGRGSERSVFLHPLLDAIGAYLRALPIEARAALAAGWEGPLHDLLADEVPDPGNYQRASPEIEHRQALEAVAVVLERLAKSQPTVLVVEHLHHAGGSALEAIDLARARLGHQPLLIVATARPEEVRLSHMLAQVDTTVDVGPLDLAATQQLALDSGVPELAATIHEATGGDPLFVTEALRLARDAGPQAAATALAGELSGVVLERTARCGAQADELLRMAATFGTVFDLDAVAALAGLTPEAAAHLAERALVAGLVVVRQHRFAFASSVIRDVLYEATPAPIRVSRHRRAAVLPGTTPEVRAHHLDAAGDWEAATEAWMEAAEQARRRFANRDADRLLESALASAERSADDPRVAELLLFRAAVRVDLARYADARADLEAALERNRLVGDEELEARVLTGLGWTAYYARDAEGAAGYAERVTSLAEHAAQLPRALPNALALLGRVRHWAGDIDGAAAAYRQALDGDRDATTEASALSCLGALLEHGDRYTEAIEVLGRAIAAADAIQSSRSLLRALFFAGLARANAGDLAGALRVLQRKRAILDRYDLRFYRARTSTVLSWVWRELGDLPRATDFAAQALEESLAVDAGAVQTEQEVHAHQALAECALLAGDTATVEAELDLAETTLDAWLPFRWRANLRQLELRSRLDPTLGEALLDEARVRSSGKYEALALARLGRPDLAVSVAERTGSVLLVAQVAPPEQAHAAAMTLAGRLTPELRDGFLRHGAAARVQ